MERIIEYNTEEEEAAADLPEQRPPADWPSRGAITVTDLVVRYRPELEPVLHGLNFEVKSCEKIGVCGRTGRGGGGAWACVAGQELKGGGLGTFVC